MLGRAGEGEKLVESKDHFTGVSVPCRLLFEALTVVADRVMMRSVDPRIAGNPKWEEIS